MRHIVKKYISFSAGLWIKSLLSFFMVPVISWLVDPSEFGKATMYSTAYAILQILIPFGTPNSFLRFYYQKSEEERSVLLWSCLKVPLLLWGVSSVGLVLSWEAVSLFLVNIKDYTVVLLLSLHALISIFQIFNQNLIRLRERGRLYSAVLLVESCANPIFLFILLPVSGRTFYSVLYAQVLASLASLMVGVFFERNYWFPVKVEKRLVTEVVKYGYPFVFSGIVWLILNWIDRIVLRIYVDFSAIGLYSTAFKLSSVLGLFTSGFSTIWYPYAYQQYEKSPESKTIFSKTLNYVSFFVFLLGFLILGFKDVIFLLFAKTYRSAATISPFLLLSPIMLTLSVVVARGIDFSKKTYWFIISDGTAALFNLVGNFALIPILGAKGAAISTGLSMIIVFAIESSASERLYPVGYNVKRVYLLTSFFVVVALFNTFVMNVIVSSLVSFLGVGMTILVYKDESKKVFTEGLETMRELLHKR
ncbi:MAG: oligosaccharide flippase family protein [Pseudothermotoga sp.]